LEINRRRAPSSEISRAKKLSGHKVESVIAELIGGEVIKGTKKADFIDTYNNVYSIKSGKKWQIFLYSYNRIANSQYLKILKLCLDSFPNNYNSYLEDRKTCISFKENYQREYGKEKAKLLSNKTLKSILGNNSYMDSKKKLKEATPIVVNFLSDKVNLKNFLNEAIFNIDEVSFLIIQDNTYRKDKCFHIFSKQTVLNTLCREINGTISEAGRVAIDYNVPGQKVIFQYFKNNGKPKNIIEIEVRNDSESKYKSIRFNMYSQDTLFLLIDKNKGISRKQIHENLVAYENAIDCFK
tara:strand:- start:1222 stop:2109 length:888 start_codon:yes stop_codon:yes gene_type:complete